MRCWESSGGIEREWGTVCCVEKERKNEGSCFVGSSLAQTKIMFCEVFFPKIAI
jgi:hypothetical protein